MSVSSMTGFARAEGAIDGDSWSWEVKSVNGRGLDIRSRLPTGFESLDGVLRAKAQAAFKRGNFNVALTIDRPQRAPRVRINRELLHQLVALAREFGGDASPPRIETLLGLRGVVEEIAEEEDDDARARREVAIAASLDHAFDRLRAVREQEGSHLETLVRGHLGRLRALVAEARTAADEQVHSLRERVRAQVAELIGAEPGLAPDRLAQEVALLATKADVREELDRLDGHLTATEALVEEGGAIGRKLDFLCQELNREANTTCAKAAHATLSRVGLDLKLVIDQLREQAQNIE